MRHTIVIAICSAVTATAISFGVAQAGSQENGTTAQSSRSVVRELKGLRRDVRTLDRHVGSSAISPNSLRGDLREALGSSRFDTGSVRSLAREICENTQGDRFGGCN